jgi:hypothetical protein
MEFSFIEQCADVISLETRARDSMSYPAYEYQPSSCDVMRFGCNDHRAGRRTD